MIKTSINDQKLYRFYVSFLFLDLSEDSQINSPHHQSQSNDEPLLVEEHVGEGFVTMFIWFSRAAPKHLL